MKSSHESLDAWLRTAIRGALEEGRPPSPPQSEAPRAPIVLALLAAVAARRWGEAAEMAREASKEIDDWPLAAEFLELVARLPALIRAEKRHPGMQAHLRENVNFENRSDHFAGLAIQGPNARKVFEAFFGASRSIPAHNEISEIKIDGACFFVARTGRRRAVPQAIYS